MVAQGRIGKITAAVTPQSSAQGRIGRISATVTPSGAGGAKGRIGKITATVVAAQTAPSGTRYWLGGKFVQPGNSKVWTGPTTAGTSAPSVEWNGTAWTPSSGPTVPPSTLPPIPGFTLLVNDEFATLDPTRWYPYDNSTFGAPDRIQRYMARNVVIGAASDGDGRSLQLISKRESVGGNPFTAGMLDTKTAGWTIPIFHRVRSVMRFMHGQGVWQAHWATALNGGADMFELDYCEIFEAQTPGRAMITLHRKNNAGVTQYNVAKSRSADGYGGIFFEAPNATGGSFHEFITEVYPVTDATGATAGAPDQPSSYVRIKGYIDRVKVFDYVDTQALYWTTNAGGLNIYLQGSQINGKYVGHPDDPLGYSRLLNACISGGGTAPNSCNTSFAGQPIVRAQFPNTFEIKSHTVWEYTG